MRELDRRRIVEQLTKTLQEGGVADASVEARQIVDAATRAAGSAEWPGRATAMVVERLTGRPLGHLTGRSRFMGIELLTTPGALAPRVETELLGEAALEILRALSPAPEFRVIDMCCGSGNLACGLAVNHPLVQAWASDLTEGAVSLARANAEYLALADRVKVVQGDLFEPLAPLALQGTIDMIVCNPPYVSTGKLESESRDLLLYEPREAFDGGPYGISIVQRVVRCAPLFLKPGGHLLFEIGAGQGRQVALLFERAGVYEATRMISDANGVARVAVGRRQ